MPAIDPEEHEHMNRWAMVYPEAFGLVWPDREVTDGPSQWPEGPPLLVVQEKDYADPHWHSVHATGYWDLYLPFKPAWPGWERGFGR